MYEDFFLTRLFSLQTQCNAGAELHGQARHHGGQQALAELPGAEPEHHRAAVLRPDPLRGALLPLRRRVRHLPGVHQPHPPPARELKQVPVPV